MRKNLYFTILLLITATSCVDDVGVISGSQDEEVFTYTDPRDGEEYLYLTIETARGPFDVFINPLRYAGDSTNRIRLYSIQVPSSLPNGYIFEKSARLYIPVDLYNQDLRPDICPPGWRTGTAEEWESIYIAIADHFSVTLENVGIILKSPDAWGQDQPIDHLTSMLQVEPLGYCVSDRPEYFSEEDLSFTWRNLGTSVMFMSETDVLVDSCCVYKTYIHGFDDSDELQSDYATRSLICRAVLPIRQSQH